MATAPLLPNTTQRVLVTGGAGFIGGAVVRRLLNGTKSRVFNLDKLGYASDLTSIEALPQAGAAGQPIPLYGDGANVGGAGDHGNPSERTYSKVGWRPRHSFEQGLEATVRWYLERYCP